MTVSHGHLEPGAHKRKARTLGHDRTGGADEIRFLAHGMLGYGFPESTLENAVSKGIDVVAIDAGSTDIGPYYLGADVPFVSDAMVRRDLSLLIKAAAETGATVLIGSSGGSGTRAQTLRLRNIVLSLVDDANFTRPVFTIDTELDPEQVARALRSGRIETFETASDLTEDDVRGAAHIVAQMGPEPYIEALGRGAGIVIGGRAWDVSAFVAVPAMEGFDRGLAAHLGKMLECGGQAALPVEGSDLLYGRLFRDHFVVEAPNPDKRCTVHSVAAHTFYEKQDPYSLHGPGGTVDLRDATFTQLNDGKVAVSGSRWVPDRQYRLKLEGARLSGYRHVCVAGIREQRMIHQLPDVLPAIQSRLEQNLGERIKPSEYTVNFRKYGIDGVLGELEPQSVAALTDAHEVGLVIDVVADSAAIAESVCALVRSLTMHWAYPGRIATGGNLAVPFSPADFAAPPVYEFSIYHLMAVDDLSQTFDLALASTGRESEVTA